MISFLAATMILGCVVMVNVLFCDAGGGGWAANVIADNRKKDQKIALLGSTKYRQ